MAKVSVIGAGAWGTAVAKVIAENGNEVTLWCWERETAEDVNSRRVNSRFLPRVLLPSQVRAETDIEQAAEGRDFLILASPSLYLLSTVKSILGVRSLREGQTAIGVLTKGFLPGENGPRLIIETLEDYLPGFYQRSLVYIAGPSHAEEVSRGKITGLIAASESAKNSFRFRDLIRNRYMLVYSSLDVKGVQVAAATKNVIAIAFGVMDALKTKAARGAGGADGAVSGSGAPVPDDADTAFGEGAGGALMFGDGTASLLLAAGLNEIQTLGKALGATHAETFSSIAGIGDLDVTCRSIYGRNRRFGREIVEKDILAPFRDIDDLIARIAELDYLPEGVTAARHVRELAARHSLKMPVCTELYRILNKEISPEQVLTQMLGQG
ncbi:MAG: NAD(P)-dependent glycerol-3-phosphate dehydrogenase [Treponematales bacterium]